MKKIVMILLTAAMVLASAACAKGNETPANGGNAESPQNSIAASQASTNNSSILLQAAAPSETELANGESGNTQGSSPDVPVSEPAKEPGKSKILVAYFSATNNTEGVAQKLAEGIGADLYEIIPEQPYTDEDLNYGNSGSRTSVEMNDENARPAISGSVENMDQYEVVFIGYPIWWGEAPRIMSTFMESYDFSGKTLAAFCTSASSGFGNSDLALRSAADKATWLDGHRFSADTPAEDILEWVHSLGLAQISGS